MNTNNEQIQVTDFIGESDCNKFVLAKSNLKESEVLGEKLNKNFYFAVDCDNPLSEDKVNEIKEQVLSFMCDTLLEFGVVLERDYIMDNIHVGDYVFNIA